MSDVLRFQNGDIIPCIVCGAPATSWAQDVITWGDIRGYQHSAAYGLLTPGCEKHPPISTTRDSGIRNAPLGLTFATQEMVK